MIFFVDGLLWLIALALGLVAASRSRKLLLDSARERPAARRRDYAQR